MKLIPLTAWAASRYSPAPSMWVLRKWARAGEISPSPERVGKSYYVREDAQRIGQRPMTLLDRLRAA